MARSTWTRVLLLAFLLGASGPVGGAAGAAEAATSCSGSLSGDVNGDGHAEVAIVDDHRSGAGRVHVLYGQPGGLVADASGTALDDQLLDQDTPGVPGANEPGDRFGESVVLDDLNGDGCADLAVGVPGEDRGRGRVVVFTGSPTGLRATGVQTFGEDGLLGPGSARPDEEFGVALAAGDFDGDGVTDLAVGASGERVGSQVAAGSVFVLTGVRGGALGTRRPVAVLSEATEGVPGVAEAYNGFGNALAAADYDGRGAVDLAVGVSSKNGEEGAVAVLKGTTGTGLTGSGAVSLSQDSPGVPGTGEPGDLFGAALAGGDLTGDGRAELVVGVPGENRDTSEEQDSFDGEGAVVVLPGSSTGPTATGSRRWNQNSQGVGGVAGPYDQFGSTLVVAPLDGDRYPDVAIGSPSDEVRGHRFAGSVTLLRGGRSGLTTAGAGGTRYTPDSPGISGSSRDAGLFGFSLTAAPVQSGRPWNLIVGEPSAKVGTSGAGVVHQLATAPAGPEGSGSRAFTAVTPGVKGGDPGSGFGFGLALG